MDENPRDVLLAAVLRLCSSTSNDVLKLALMDREELMKCADTLDLTMLGSFERTAQGGVKIKVFDRARTLSVALGCALGKLEPSKEAPLDPLSASIMEAMMDMDRGGADSED